MTRLNGRGSFPDPKQAIQILQYAASAGVKFIDTAWYYGPDSVLELISSALHPYPETIVCAKIGNSRNPRTHDYEPRVSPSQLVHACHRTLRGLRSESVALLLLRWRSDLHVDQFDAAWETMAALQQAGKAVEIGLSNVSLSDIKRAEHSAKVAAVSNAFSFTDQTDEHVVRYCEERRKLFLAYYPLNRGAAAINSQLLMLGRSHGLSAQQFAIVWLLRKSPAVVPIPGTSRMSHLLANISANRYYRMNWGH